jgi:hypothetical protein
MRASDTSQAIQMLDLLLEFFADGPLPNRRPRLSTSQAPRLERAQSWLRCARRPAPRALMIPSPGGVERWSNTLLVTCCNCTTLVLRTAFPSSARG